MSIPGPDRMPPIPKDQWTDAQQNEAAAGLPALAGRTSSVRSP